MSQRIWLRSLECRFLNRFKHLLNSSSLENCGRALIVLHMSAQEIEQAIAKLPPEEFFRLRASIQRRFNEEWDAQIQRDAATGKLDSLAAQAIADHRAGLSKPFPADAE